MIVFNTIQLIIVINTPLHIVLCQACMHFLSFLKDYHGTIKQEVQLMIMPVRLIITINCVILMTIIGEVVHSTKATHSDIMG